MVRWRSGQLIWVEGKQATMLGLVLFRRGSLVRVRVAGVGVLWVAAVRCRFCRLRWSDMSQWVIR